MAELTEERVREIVKEEVNGRMIIAALGNIPLEDIKVYIEAMRRLNELLKKPEAKNRHGG